MGKVVFYLNWHCDFLKFLEEVLPVGLMVKDNYSHWVAMKKMDLKGIKRIDLIPT